MHEDVIVRRASAGRSEKALKAMNMIATEIFSRGHEHLASTAAANQGVVAVVSDDQATIESLAPVCEFLDLRMQVISSGADVADILREHRLMAVISDIECKDHDGYYVMKVIARFDHDLPILLLTKGESVLMGAADAVQGLCGLTSVTSTSGFPMAGQLVAFLFGAGRRAGCMRLVPV
jgi:CheY-like chemotaxis protein